MLCIAFYFRCSFVYKIDDKDTTSILFDSQKLFAKRSMAYMTNIQP